MKVNVITLHSVANYGTQLQALATQEKLKEYFDEVRFFDFRRHDTYGTGLLKTFSKGNIFKGIAILPTLLVWHFRFRKFREKYLNLTDKKFLGTEDFDNFKGNADYYAVGSDQVWNTGWNNGIIPALYLNFVGENKNKFSFSSSFGMNKLAEKDVSEVKKYLKTFKNISVREPSGVEIIKNQLKIDGAIQLVDPVLSLPASFWRQISPKTKMEKKYILVYSLNKNKDLDMYAKKLSKKTGLCLIRFCTRVDQIVRTGHGKIIPKVLDFVSFIDNAEYVITDSFHATAFSMLMNTEPICIYPKKYSNRISEFLNLIDENERHLTNYSDFDIVNKSVNFERVNAILKIERQRVDEYLKKVVSD